MPRKNILSLHEAIVVALINQPIRTASFEEIAKFIEQRNLYPERKGNIPLATQVMLRATKAKGAYHHLFEDLGAGYIRLKDSNADAAKVQWNVLDAILEHNKKLFGYRSATLRVFDIAMKSFRKIEIFPNNVVWAGTKKRSGEKKYIYIKEIDLSGKEIIGQYTIHKGLAELLKILDPLNHCLAIVTDSILINVAFFKTGKDRRLKTNLSFKEVKELPEIKFSTSKAATDYLKTFRIVQQSYVGRICLENSILKSKSELEQDL